MADKKNIYETIAAVMADIGVVGKTSKNQAQNFMFRGIDAVMNALNPAMIKHKMFVVPEILEQTREERQSSRGTLLIHSICKIKYTFYAEDGSSISAVVIGEGMDSGDKATNKAMAIAMKYACFQTFCIPTEEMKNDDPDYESHTVSQKQNTAPKQDLTPNPKRANLLKALYFELARTGVGQKSLVSAYGADNVDALTTEQLQTAVDQLRTKPAKKAPDKQAVNEGFQTEPQKIAEESLPFR